MSAPSSNKRPLLYLAEFESPDDLISAAEKVRDAGFEKWDVHTPYPVHGMDTAMGMGDSRLGWIVLLCGLTGVTGAVTMIQYMNGFDYPLVIGGKPPDAYASMVPIMFELTVLLSAFGAVFGMLGLNQLPKHHHPVFFSERFEQFSHDKFFVSIEAQDKNFDVDKTRTLLESCQPSHLELVEQVEIEEAES
jgi:Alternative complex III, ActD subunit